MNLAFIDGQNLYMGTMSSNTPWKVDLIRFRTYLEKKYHVSRAYYFIGYVQETNQDLYELIQSAGFILVFRQHNSAMVGKKKGNVDTDIVFTILKKMVRKEPFDKVVLISGDGDYKMLVDFLIEENRLAKILFPNRKYASSLFKEIGSQYYDHLDQVDIKKKIAKEKGSLGS